MKKKLNELELFNQKSKTMKGKYLLGALFMAIFGAFVALFAYTRLIDRPSERVSKDISALEIPQARPVLTSYQEFGGQVDFTYAAEQTVHAVVHVRITTKVPYQDNPILEFFYGPDYKKEASTMTGWGSGVIISPDGYIITNNHVIEEADEVNVTLNNRREYKAQVVGRDPSTDIALLKIDAKDLPYIKYGDSDQLKLGEWVLAVGNPFNLTSTVTAGIVSAKSRSLGITNDYAIESFIQTDAALNMGNSGGALVNTKGLLVGITSAIKSPNGLYAGNSFAIPINIVKKIVDDLRQFKVVQRAIIGVNIKDLDPELIEKESLRLDEVKGVLVTDIVAGGSADDAGLKKKDVIVKVNGVDVSSVAELKEQVNKFRPGDKTEVTFIRDGKQSTVPIVMKSVDNDTKVIVSGEGGGVVFGARVEGLSQEERSTYKIDGGVRVADPGEGRLKDLGIRRGYIILSINGKKVRTASDVKEVTNNEKTLTAIEGIQSNGTFFSYQFRR
jgi:serine protease Do